MGGFAFLLMTQSTSITIVDLPPSLPPSLPTLAIPSTTALSFLSTARLSSVTCSSPLPLRGRSKARTT